jgi:hypothetical protein
MEDLQAGKLINILVGGEARWRGKLFGFVTFYVKKKFSGISVSWKNPRRMEIPTMCATG